MFVHLDNYLLRFFLIFLLNKLSLLAKIAKLFFALLLFTNAFATGQEFDSATVGQLDEALKSELSPCATENDQSKIELETAISSVILSSDIFIDVGEVITISGGGQAIVDEYDSKTKTLNYHQTADTGFMLFSIGEIITGYDSEATIIVGRPKEAIVPCFERIVSTDEDAREMLYISEESLNDVLASLQVHLDKQRVMAISSLALLQEMLVQEEIAAFEAELAQDLANQAALSEIAEFEAKLAEELANQSQVEYDKKVAELMEQLALEKELAAFEAQLEAELVAQEMMAEIIAEEALAKKLAEFQAKLEAEKAAAARSTAIYQARLQQEQIIKDNQARLAEEALAKELADFEAQLEAELAQQAVEREIAEFEAEYEAQQARLADAKFEAEYEAQQTKLRLAKFQEKLEAEKAAAAASTAAYQSKLAYEAKVNKIMEDLTRELELAKELDEFESKLAEELVAQATVKLEDEKVVGAISGEIVTVAGHESCKDTLNLSDHNVDLFKLSLAGDYLYNVGPLSQFGTEFSVNRWDKYISCIGSYNE